MTGRWPTGGVANGSLRVGEELRHALAYGHGAAANLRDPICNDVCRSPSAEVRMSHDLRNATAFVLPLGGREGDVVLAALRRAAPYLRGQVGRAMVAAVYPKS